MYAEEEKQYERQRVQAGAGSTGGYYEAETAGWYVYVPLFRRFCSFSFSLRRGLVLSYECVALEKKSAEKGGKAK